MSVLSALLEGRRLIRVLVETSWLAGEEDEAITDAEFGSNLAGVEFSYVKVSSLIWTRKYYRSVYMRTEIK